MSAQFWLIIAALLVLALLILVLPLLKKRDLLFVDAEQRNLSIARQQLAELKLQLQQGLLSEAQYHAQYQELQQSLQDDLDAAAAAPKPVADDRWIIPLLLFLMPLLSLGLYFHLADPEALQKSEVQQARDKSVAELHGMIVKIIERLKQNPNDMEGWMMLGRSYSYLQEYAEAANVFEKLNQMQPDNVQVLLSYADTLAMSRNGQLAGKPAELIDRAITLAPDNNDALWMAGMAKAEAGNAAQATVYWQKLANSLPADSPALPQVRQMLAELNAPQAAVATTSASSLNIHVAVTVDASIKASIKPDQVLFIYAQALNGPKMPLAIVRKQAAELPLAVDLNDSMAMQPGLHLADFKQLKIIARISKTGNASTQSGDFIGTTELGLPYNEQPVSVTINQEVK